MRCTSWSLRLPPNNLWPTGNGGIYGGPNHGGRLRSGTRPVGRVPGRSRSCWLLCICSPFLAVLGGGSVLSAPLLSRFVSVATSRVPRAIFPTCLDVWCNVMQPGGQTDALCLDHVYKISMNSPFPSKIQNQKARQPISSLIREDRQSGSKLQKHG